MPAARLADGLVAVHLGRQLAAAALPGGRFSARTNRLALHFALRAIAAQPGDYAAAVGHDFALSFFWDRPVHPDAGIVDRYQFADAATAWVPATMRTPGGGTVAGDQAAL